MLEQKRRPAMQRNKNLQQCYLLTFEGEAGSAVLDDLEARAFVRGTSFSVDPQRAAFNEGRRSLVLHIRRMLEGQSQENGAARPSARGGPELAEA